MRARVKQHLEELAWAVDATSRSGGFNEALQNMARFWRYSLFNQFLILMQCKRATHVTGLRTWESIGRKVRPGEQPIVVLAPSSRGQRAVHFLGVPVYDVRQTRGRKLRTLDVTLRGATRHWRILEQAAGQLGVELAYTELPDGFRGRSLGGRIEVLPRLPGRERTAVLAHELAHEVLHQAERRRRTELRRPGPVRTHAEVETEAEATAYVVLAVLGLPSRAPEYIAWQRGTGLTVLRSMTRVQRAAKAILLAAGIARTGP